MAKSDDILKKYGITQVRGSEKGTGTTGGNSYSSGATGTGVKKADDILSKYGIAQVRGKTGDFDKWKKDSEDIISRITSAGEHDETSMAQMYQLMAAGSNYRDQYRDDAETAGYIDSVVSRIAKAESYASEAKDRYARVTSPIEDWDMYAGKRGWESYTSETAQRQQALAQEEEDKKWWEKLLGYLGEVQDTSLPTGSVQKVIDDVREDTSYREPTDEWTNGERYIFGYLYQTDKSQAYHYAASVNEAINKEKEEEQLKKIAESAADGFWSGAAHTAGAIATAPLGLADYLSDLVYANAGKPIRSDGTVSPFEYSQAVTGGISEKLNEKYGTLNEKIPVIGGKGLGDVYGLGTSVAQSALAGYTGGQLGTLVQFFGSAAAAGVDEAKQRGATDEQALQMGTLSGAAEGLAEMIGVDNLLKIGSSATMRQLLTNLVKQGAAEGIEEGLTTLMNNFADQWVMKDKSNFNALVRQFMENGMSEEAAKKQAWLTMANDLAFDVVAGFASGVAHAGPQTVTQTVIENVYQPYQAGKAILESEGSVDALKQLANEVAGVSSADTHQAIADKIGKVDEKASALRVGKLYDTVRSANNIANASANQADIAEFLESKGFDSQKAKAVAEALVARYNGQELTKAQTKTLASVKGNADVKAAISNIVTNAKSTMGQRSDNIRAFNKDVTIGRIAKANSISAEQARKIAEGKMSTQEESLPDSHYEVSADGKTIDKDGNIVTIQGIASLENGRMVLQTENGTVDAKDLHYSSQGEALVYEAVANLEGIIDTNTANKLSKHLMKLGDVSSDVYAKGIVQAYTYGYYGYGRDAMTGENTLSATLSEKQRNVAYGLGEQYRDAKTGADQANAATATVQKTAQTGKSTAPDGTQYQKVRFEGKVKKWGKKQKAEVALVDFIASNFSGNTVHVFESYKTKNGKYVYEDSNGKIHAAPNGMYIDSTGDIYLDLNAGNHGEGLVMNTFAHELYHHIQKRSPEKARKLAEFLVQELGYESVEAGVQRQIDKAEKAGHGVAHFMESGVSRSAAERMVYDRAFNDFVADSLETMFTEGDAIGKLQKLKSQDEGLFNMIKDFINKWVQKLREFYRSHSTISIEGDLVRQLEKFEQIQQMFAEALVDAGDNFRAAQEQFSTDSIRGNADGAVAQSEVTTALTESNDVLHSERTEFEALPKQTMSLSTGAGTLLHSIEGLIATKIKGLSGKTINGYTGRDVRGYAMGISGFTKAQINEVNKFMDAMADFLEKAGVTYKFIGLQDVKDAKLHYTYNADGSIKSIVLSAMVKNGDYPVNFDLSSICKKRVAMSKLIDKLAVRGSLDSGTVKLTPANIFKINTALKNEGYETACLGCFVESKRYNSLEWANKFCNKWNAAVKKVNPNATYFGYGNATFNEDSFTLEQAIKIDAAANKYITATKTERMQNALAKYKAKEEAGLPLVESFSKAARDRLVKADISEELKTKYLNSDVTTLNMADVEFLLENGILPGANLSNKQAVTEMVKSGEAYQHLLRPSDLLTDRGISKLEALPNFHGVLYGHYGSGTPKLMQSYTPYNSEIALLPNSKNSEQTLAEYLYTIAGVRMQSFSDFQIQNIYDYLQMVADLAARKVPAHAYTKEISFAKLLGMTGIKCNLSVMFDIDPMVDKAHAGLTKLNKLVHRGEYARVVLEDAQGKWVYNIGDYQTQKLFAEAYPDEAKRFLQSIGFADAVKLQSSPGYSANCGIIGVGYSDLGIFAMLDDNRIRYIIPYHASSLPAEIKVATHIELGTDYTPYQNNMKISGITDRNGNKVDWTIKEAYKRLRSGQAVLDELNEKIRSEGWVVKTTKAQNGHGSYGLYEDLQQTNDPRQTASNFMDWCIKNSTLPLFYQFTSHENYYKMLYDFNVYDCVTEEYAPQQAVTNTYPTMVDGQVQPGNVTDGGFDAEYLQGTIDKQMAFMDEYNSNLDEDLDRLADIMEEGVLFSDRDYSYEALVSKPDMVVTEVGGNVPTNRADIVAAAKKNATSVGRFDPKTGSVSVHVKDIGKDVVLGTVGLKHGLDGRRTDNAIVTVKAGEILRNSIRINELTPKKEEAHGSYVLIGAASGSNGDLYIVRSVVNTFKHELESMEVLYAINAKKGNRLRSMRPGFQGPVTDSTISIAELLDYVNEYFPDILPEEVLKHYGYDARPEGSLGEDALYSDRDNAPTFYSQMAKVVDGVKQEKLGAASVVSMLRGKGVKAEEIKWSGIETWLEGKKSVTKAELQEFIAGSMLQIEEETLTNDEIPYTDDQQKRITEHTAKRDEIAQELAEVWKQVTGNDFPIQNVGAGLESAVESKIRDVNLEKKKASFEGRLLEKLRKDLKEVIANNDDFGFDSWKEALISIHRHRKSFIDHYELSSTDKAVIVKYCNALNAYNELPNQINELDTMRLRRIAHEAELYNRKIGDVRSEHYAENAKRMTKWGQYKLKGGNNYREILFKIPGSYYYNDAMAMHWDERDGVLAHARIQDLNTFLGKMLFVEEIQSDWHNEGHKEGYDSDKEAALKKIVDLREQWNSLYNEMLEANAAESRAIYAKMEAIDNERVSLAKKVRDDKFVPDAPFKDNYHEYVLKRLLREAAEQDYDSIGWTTAETQDERWANNRPHKEGEGKSGFLKGYTIEYDQDIPKFLNKYGKKWGTRVGKTTLDSGTEIWSMAITDEMKESVLTEGQPLYSDRIDTSGMDSEATKIIRKLEIRAIGSRYDKGKYASYSAERIERELSRSSATKMDYAKSYIAWVNPEDFLYATTTSQAGRDQIEKEAGDLDLDRLRKETQPIHLTVDFETGKIVGHEGRHRMTALYKAGVEKVAVIFDAWNDDRYNTKPVNMMEIVGQEFDRYHSGIGFYVHDMLPLSRRYADATRKLFSEVDGSIKFSERSDDSVSNRSLLANAFEGVAQNDIERNKIQEYKGKISLINAEERKLSELNEKIRELSFAKGPKDTKAIRDLQFEARQTANRINTYDKQLLRLEASKPLQDVLAREKKLAYQKAEKKGKEALAAYKERAAKTQRELMDRWQESRKHGIENREKTFMRHKIQSVVGELNQLLLSNDKKRHVPDSLKKAVADALALVNMDTVGAEERAAKYAALIAKETDPDKIDAYTVTMENILRQGDKMGQRLKELRDAYEEIQESDDPDIANAYDPVIAGSLKELAGSIGNTSLRNMTIEQLSDVYDMYKMVLTRVRDANKSFLNEKKEAISALASRVVGEVRVAGGEHKYRAAFLDFARKFGWNNLKPVYAFEHIGSSTLTGAFNNVRAGEDVWAIDVTEAREYYLDKSKKYGYDSWDFKKKYRFESASGLEFDLTLDQILSLYAYSKREQAYDHLKLGGFVFDSNIETYTEKGSKLIKYRVNTADAHQITPDILASIISKLSGDQMGFVDEMQDYLSTVMGAKGNEVTMKMYGVKLFKEKFYFPLKSAKQFMFEQNEVSGEVKIKNSGFTNKVVAHANNPVILSNFMDVWSGHVNDMSMYHAFVLPLEDFNRIFNYNSPKQEGQPPVSVKGTIQSAYTPAAVNYVRQLITDLNGGARSDPATDILNKLMGLFKKGSVFASLSVVVQQPSAVARAAALVDTKYFIGPKVDHKRHKALWDEVKKYAPVAIIKEMGYFDTNMGKSTQDFIQGKEYSGFNEKMKALVTDSGYRDEALSKAPALADEIAWCSIWEAVKREMRDKHKGLDVKSEPFLMLCGSRFTEVITKTQVYDSVLSRSGLMRSKDTGLKMATAFMAEPTTSINMIAEALLQGKRGNRKYCGAAIGAVVASQILNSILVSFVYAGRDDDEDETYAEKYIGTLTGEILDSLNPAGYIPFIKDIQSIAKGYDVERSDMAVFSDLVNAYKKLSSDKLSVYRKVEGFAGSIAQILGLPVKNIMRDARGIYQTIMSFVNGQQTTKSGIGYAVKESLPGWMGGGDTSNQQQLYEAYLSGDQTHISRVKSRFKDQAAIDSAIRKALRENDPRIRDAAIAWNANDLDEYMRLAKAIIAEKHFSQDNVVMAIRAEASALEPGAETSSTSKAKGLFTAEKFAEAIAQGDEATANAARMDIIQTEQKNGKTEEEAEKSFVSSAKSELKELFMAGGISEDKAVSALTDYCGIEEQDAMADVQYWAFKNEYPDVYADDSWFDKYYKEIADTGIAIDVYMNYRNEVKNITGDGKKERRMAVIDSLPITSAQKDAMYFAEGWAASTLNEAPWH